MNSIERAYITALQDELSRARSEQHAAEVKAELARVGAPVVESASAVPVVEKAAAPRRKAASK